MEEVDEPEANWFDGSVEELIHELLDDDDDDSPLFAPPEAPKSNQDSRQKSVINKLISSVYSGPTIGDIESALSMSFQHCPTGSQAVVSFPQKGSGGKMENKYTVRIKSSANGLVDDGYKWRKYGQKSIKNSPNPRSYYRCTTPRCNAKKQVERSTEDPEMLIINYEGLHLHYAYSHFFLPRSEGNRGTSLHVPKKPKVQHAEGLPEKPDKRPVMPEASTMQQQRQEERQQQQEQQLVIIGEKTSPRMRLLRDALPDPVVTDKGIRHELLEDNIGQCPQGLLEDIVPFVVRKPWNFATSTDDPSPSSQASFPSNSPSHSPNSAHHGVGILSSIV